jgi:polysaccharide deacetylase family sporulation protein PdaB
LYARILIISMGMVIVLVTSGWQSTVVKDRKFYESRGEVVWEVATEKKVLALTFDDGPDPADTPQILDLLHKYHAKATFFVIGNRVERYPQLLLREVWEGHEVANHTYEHPYFNKNTSLHRIKDEINKAEQAILNITGQNTSLFRPPAGYFNDTIITAAHHSHHTLVLWSWHQDTKDWDTPGTDKIVRIVLDHAHNGDIVLFHDYVKGQTQTIDALKLILPALQERGFEFVTVSELLKLRRKGE